MGSSRLHFILKLPPLHGRKVFIYPGRFIPSDIHVVLSNANWSWIRGSVGNENTDKHKAKGDHRSFVGYRRGMEAPAKGEL